MTQNYQELSEYAKAFSGLTPARESCLMEVGKDIKPRLAQVTEDFYSQLLAIPAASKFLGDRVNSLKTTHLRWMEGLFTGPFDAAYAEAMFHVGDVHVKVNLPVEFMAGGMTLINGRLIEMVNELYGKDQARCQEVLGAINAILGYTLIVMQQSYQESSLAEELEKFLKISGMSRTLFTNLAEAYKDK